MMEYREILDHLQDNEIIHLMKELGANRYIDKTDCIIFPTICHNINADEASMKLYYYKNTHKFYCYTEDGSMSPFTFLKRYYETRDIDYDWYNDIYYVIKNCSNYTRTFQIGTQYKSNRDKFIINNKIPELPIYNNGILDVFIKAYPIEWLNDNISCEAMDKYNIRYSISQNKIIIPHYNAQGQLVGIRGRALDEEEIETLGKYMPVKIEETWYKHPLSLNLYGLNMNATAIKKTGYCLIYEAEQSTLSTFLLISRVTFCG